MGDGSGAAAASETTTRELSQAQIGLATSKLISASIGAVCVVLSRSARHKHYSLADIEWMVLPAVFSGQFFVAEAANTETGHRAPVAVITWARVSADVDQRLTERMGKPVRLRPDEWTCGDIHWLVDAVGDPRAIVGALKSLMEGPFKGIDVKVATTDGQGAPRVEMLRDLAAKAAFAGGAG